MLFLCITLNDKKLHIISFDNPFPPNYGGVIDVFYKIKALHSIGFSIYLHCFYEDRNEVSKELNEITEQVFLYKKNRKPAFLLSSIPLSVTSRFHKGLVKNILAIDAPILFEGLQSTMIINKSKFLNRNIFLRLHNLESNFYSGMSKNENSFFKKFLYYLESKKYSVYQNKIVDFNHVFALSKYEYEFVKTKTEKISYLPVFHGNQKIETLSEFGMYAFYHGDLRLPDNKKAVAFLIKLFQKIPDYKLVIASSDGRKYVENKAIGIANIEFVELIIDSQLDDLFKNAHINVMLSFQQSGTKLKVVNSLFRSRFCLINNNMIDDAEILKFCEIANSENEFITKIKMLKDKPFLDFENRHSALNLVLNDVTNAKKIEKIISNQ